MHLNLEGKTAIITGGGSGVGREIARLFYEEGGNVAVVDIVAEKARETVAMLQGGAGKAAAFTADVTDYTRVMEMAASVLDTFGQIDVLFNNAGYGIYKPFADSTPEDWALDINVNLYGTLNCTRAVINHMIERHYGKIINIISDAARVGEPSLSTYSAAKAGMAGFARTLAKEVGRYGINVNCVSLGTIKTPLIEPLLTPEFEQKMVKSYPLKRLGLPEEPARMAVFLASDQCGWVTGQVIPVNGGYATI